MKTDQKGELSTYEETDLHGNPSYCSAILLFRALQLRSLLHSPPINNKSPNRCLLAKACKDPAAAKLLSTYVTQLTWAMHKTGIVTNEVYLSTSKATLTWVYVKHIMGIMGAVTNWQDSTDILKKGDFGEILK